MLVHVLVLVSQLLRTAAVRPLRLLQRDIAFPSSSATAWLRAFCLNELLARLRAEPRVLRTLLHVLRVVWWSPSTTLSSLRALRVWSSAALARHADVAIHLRSALAEGLSVDAIVFCVHFRSASKLQSRRT